MCIHCTYTQRLYNFPRDAFVLSLEDCLQIITPMNSFMDRLATDAIVHQKLVKFQFRMFLLALSNASVLNVHRIHHISSFMHLNILQPRILNQALTMRLLWFKTSQYFVTHHCDKLFASQI